MNLTRQQAVYITFIVAEALNDPDFRKKIELLYGTHGTTEAASGIKEIADGWNFEPPVLQ